MEYEEKENKNDDYQNDWAKNIKGEYIHILHSKSGLLGYYCLGCDKEMQAVKFKNPKFQSYFRHHAHNIDKDKTECVFASKVYRERLAEQILHLLKEIKAPALFKYPPKGIDGIPMLLKESETIKAFTVKSQLSFYENEDGAILCGKNPGIEDRYLLIRPDITFFDEKGNPILFIEFVITHKLDSDKRLKLQRIGIDTVQIIIPKVPEDEIRKVLKSVTKFKWVYNELEANTEYVSVSEGNSEGISSIDEDQRKLFEESYLCRTSQINGLIRDIKRCLQTESYRTVELLFESELSRVKGNTKREKQELERLDESNRTRALDRNRESERKFKESYGNLESRYNTKRKELDDAVKTYNSEKGITDSIIYQIENFQSAIKRIEEETREFDKHIESEENRMEEEVWREFIRETELVVGRIEEIRVENEIIEDKIRTSIDTKIKSTEKSIGNIGIRQKRIDDTIRRDFRTKIEFEESEIERFEREERELETTVRDEFHRECIEHPAKLSERIRNILETERLANNFELAKRQEARYKRAYELFRKGTWEKR